MKKLIKKLVFRKVGVCGKMSVKFCLLFIILKGNKIPLVTASEPG